ncbi:MAG TPA: hypothetical protein VI732_06295 [Alphaproteobacteria bacterium]|nr:hypothetical protein [Alphaproteobacteria bacterium]
MSKLTVAGAVTCDALMAIRFVAAGLVYEGTRGHGRPDAQRTCAHARHGRVSSCKDPCRCQDRDKASI